MTNKAVILIIFLIIIAVAFIQLYREFIQIITFKDNEIKRKDMLNNLLNISLHSQLNSEHIELREMELTFYAPLDPSAVEGVCYSGDPKITASGYPTTIGLSAAADPSLPFGTMVYTQEFGWRIIHDRGGSIKGNRLDIAVHTVDEAIDLGRITTTVLILYPEESE